MCRVYEATAGLWSHMHAFKSFQSHPFEWHDGEKDRSQVFNSTLEERGGEKDTCMMIQGYENRSDTCAPNKWWSEGIKDLGEWRIWDHGIELAAGALYEVGPMPGGSLGVWQRGTGNNLSLHNPSFTGERYGLRSLRELNGFIFQCFRMTLIWKILYEFVNIASSLSCRRAELNSAFTSAAGWHVQKLHERPDSLGSSKKPHNLVPCVTLIPFIAH